MRREKMKAWLYALAEFVVVINAVLVAKGCTVFCKCKFLKFADKNGEFCISVLEKVAGCPAGLPDAS